MVWLYTRKYMKIKEIKEIKYEKVAIIINCGTVLYSTLAILSIKKHSNLPIVLIDCDTPNSGWDKKLSFKYFDNLMNHIDFDLLSLPLNIHGKTLDNIFREIQSKIVLLLDSDAEILNSNIVDLFIKYSSQKQFWGSGFKTFFRKTTDFTYNILNGLYMERVFMPFCILNVEKVNEALCNNISFEAFIKNNDFPFNKKICKILRKRYKLPFFKKRPHIFTKYFTKGQKFHDHYYPDWLYYDTGAKIYEYLCYNKEYWFCELSEDISTDYLLHAYGTTRGFLTNDKDANRQYQEKLLIDRMYNEYNFDIKNTNYYDIKKQSL